MKLDKLRKLKRPLKVYYTLPCAEDHSLDIFSDEARTAIEEKGGFSREGAIRGGHTYWGPHHVNVAYIDWGSDGRDFGRFSEGIVEALSSSDISFFWIAPSDALRPEDGYGELSWRVTPFTNTPIVDVGMSRGFGIFTIVAFRFKETQISFCHAAGVADLAMVADSAGQAWDIVLGLLKPADVDLKTMPYDEYLKTDHWQKIAHEAKERAGHRCQLCNRYGELHTHHRTYARRGAELPEDLIVLCASCHRVFHENGRLAGAR